MPKPGYKSITVSDFVYYWIESISKKEKTTIPKAISKRFGIN